MTLSLFIALALAGEPDWKAPTKLMAVEASQGQIHIRTEGAQANVKTFSVSDPPKVVVELYDTWVPLGLEPMLEEQSDSSLVTKIRVAQFAKAPRHIARVVVDLKESMDYKTKQLNGKVTLEFAGKTSAPLRGASEDARPAGGGSPAATLASSPEPETQSSKAPTPAAPPAKNSPAKTSRQGSAGSSSSSRDILRELPSTPIDINFQNVDVRTVLSIIIEKLESLSGRKINLLVGQDVTGTMTIELKQAPFNEAFQTILAMRELVAVQSGSNILKVVGPTGYLAEQTKAITTTQIMLLNYISAGEMKSHLDTIRNLEGRKGNILIANDINALIVTDTEEGLQKTARLIKELDVRPRAVSIEAKIVDLQIDKAVDYGIEWQWAMDWNKSDGTTIDRRTIGATNPNSGAPIGGLTGSLPANPARISLPPGGTAVTTMGISLGRVTNNTFLTSALTLAAREGKLKVLSNPKIVTLNNQAATIQAGSQVPTVQTTVSPGVGTTQSVAYKDVGVLLSVKPVITSDRYIRMQIQPTVSQVGAGGLPGVAPAVLTRTATTNLIVKDAETAVIGGLITQRTERQTIKVPILGDLPLIGWLFRRTSRDDPRTELLVFVTPKILD